MNNWRKRAEDALRETSPRDNRDNRDEMAAVGGFVPNVPIVPLDHIRAMRDWRVALDALSFRTPLHGLEMARWRQVLGDAHWLLDHYADGAARDGWTGGDLFGLLPGHDGWGGVADRLRSSRSLVMTADTARWRRLVTDTPDQYSRGELPGIKPLWERR